MRQFYFTHLPINHSLTNHYWAYRYEAKTQGAKSDNGYVTRAVSCPRNQVEAVQGAISSDWSVQKILKLIKGANDPTT